MSTSPNGTVNDDKKAGVAALAHVNDVDTEIKDEEELARMGYKQELK